MAEKWKYYLDALDRYTRSKMKARLSTDDLVHIRDSFLGTNSAWENEVSQNKDLRSRIQELDAKLLAAAADAGNILCVTDKLNQELSEKNKEIKSMKAQISDLRTTVDIAMMTVEAVKTIRLLLTQLHDERERHGAGSNIAPGVKK